MVSVTIPHLSVQEVQIGLWIQVTQWKSVKNQNICAMLFGCFCILIRNANIFLISKLSDNWWTKKKKKKKKNWCLDIKLEKDIWLPIWRSNISSLLTLQARWRRFVKVWSEFASRRKMATATPILSNFFY